MSDKDITEKLLESYNDVFADIVNVLLFDGRQLVREDALDDADRLSEYKAADELHGQERDVAKFWRGEGDIRICLYGLENQTGIDTDIPLRVVSYDGAGYRAQLLADKDRDKDGKKRKKPRFPVVTLVLYFGEDKWKRPRSLLECLKVPDELKPYVSDYKVNVFEIAWLPPETVAKFRSDFRIVADYFVQMRMNKDYNPPQETVRHVHEVLHLMAAVSGNRKFEETLRTEWRKKHGTGGEDMIDVFDKWEQRGRRDIQTLMKCLLEQNRIDDLRRASTDSEYLEKLLVEQGIAQPTSPRGAPRP